MPTIALLADIHGNLEALEAVLADLEPHHPSKIIVLGDTVGYGPDPRACLARVTELTDLLLVGNHEKELVDPTDEMTDEAQDALHWTATALQDSTAWQRLAVRVRAQGEAAGSSLLEGCRCVHGSPRSPFDQYIWPAHPCQYLLFNDQIDQRLAGFLGEFETQHGFFGHTHAPAVLARYDARKIFDPYGCSGLEWHRRTSFIGPTTLYIVPEGSPTLRGLAGHKLAINPGSVGQPRFVGDPAACYALYDGDSVTFRRVDYDRGTTLRKLGALPLADETVAFLVERLETGE